MPWMNDSIILCPVWGDPVLPSSPPAGGPSFACGPYSSAPVIGTGLSVIHSVPGAGCGGPTHRPAFACDLYNSARVIGAGLSVVHSVPGAQCGGRESSRIHHPPTFASDLYNNTPVTGTGRQTESFKTTSAHASNRSTFCHFS